MYKYSVTLNFFIPEKIVKAVGKIKIPGRFMYDWRQKGIFHCTVKGLQHRETLPSKQEIKDIINKTAKVLTNQKKFKVDLKGISKFPNVIYAKIKSAHLTKLHKKLCDVNLPSINKKFEVEGYIPYATVFSLSEPYNKKIAIDEKFGEFIVKEIQLVIWDISNGHVPKTHHCFNLK